MNGDAEIALIVTLVTITIAGIGWGIKKLWFDNSEERQLEAEIKNLKVTLEETISNQVKLDNIYRHCEQERRRFEDIHADFKEINKNELMEKAELHEKQKFDKKLEQSVRLTVAKLPTFFQSESKCVSEQTCGPIEIAVLKVSSINSNTACVHEAKLQDEFNTSKVEVSSNATSYLEQLRVMRDELFTEIKQRQAEVDEKIANLTQGGEHLLHDQEVLGREQDYHVAKQDVTLNV